MLWQKRCYKKLRTKKPDSTKSLKAEAEKENAEAQVKLGKCYVAGDSVKEDDAEAVKWFRKAGKDCECYLMNVGVKEDKAEAAKWLRRAWKDCECYLMGTSKNLPCLLLKLHYTIFVVLMFGG
jgi:TPR repeat protein